VPRDFKPIEAFSQERDRIGPFSRDFAIVEYLIRVHADTPCSDATRGVKPPKSTSSGPRLGEAHDGEATARSDDRQRTFERGPQRHHLAIAPRGYQRIDRLSNAGELDGVVVDELDVAPAFTIDASSRLLQHPARAIDARQAPVRANCRLKHGEVAASAATYIDHVRSFEIAQHGDQAFTVSLDIQKALEEDVREAVIVFRGVIVTLGDGGALGREHSTKVR
jgi:hypothetical protein